MSIRHIGIETAKDIANHFGTFEKLWSYLLEELEKEKEVEKVIANEKVVMNEIKGGLEDEKIEGERKVEEEVEKEGEVEGMIEDQSDVMISGNGFYFLFFVWFQ